jgi:hypothetical protein
VESLLGTGRWIPRRSADEGMIKPWLKPWLGSLREALGRKKKKKRFFASWFVVEPLTVANFVPGFVSWGSFRLLHYCTE